MPFCGVPWLGGADNHGIWSQLRLLRGKLPKPAAHVLGLLGYGTHQMGDGFPAKRYQKQNKLKMSASGRTAGIKPPPHSIAFPMFRVGELGVHIKIPGTGGVPPTLHFQGTEETAREPPQGLIISLRAHLSHDPSLVNGSSAG